MEKQSLLKFALTSFIDLHEEKPRKAQVNNNMNKNMIFFVQMSKYPETGLNPTI